MPHIALYLSPTGRLNIEQDEASLPELDEQQANQLHQAFQASNGYGLLHLVTKGLSLALPPTLSFWRTFAQRYFTAFSHTPGLKTPEEIDIPPPSEIDLALLIYSAPPMHGLENLTVDHLTNLWQALQSQLKKDAASFPGSLQEYWKKKHPLWHQVGRVTFHLAENRNSEVHPFAFMATYTQQVSEQAKVQHLPLGRALVQYANAKDRQTLTSLLTPVQEAAKRSPLIEDLLSSKAIFHPQAWTPAQAHSFLKIIPQIEDSGIMVRVPNWWRSQSPSRPQVSVTIGEEKKATLGLDSMLDFSVSMTLDGEPLSDAEWESIRSSTQELVFLRGQWVEVDRDRLTELLDHWEKVEKEQEGNGLTFIEGMRLLSGFSLYNSADDFTSSEKQWMDVSAGNWLRETLAELRTDSTSNQTLVVPNLNAELRPYQAIGVQWLKLITQLGLGACLADDMGLGKTIQVIALLLYRSESPQSSRSLNLLVVPASLIANWKAELQKFAPSLNIFFVHSSETDPHVLKGIALNPDGALAKRKIDLVITSYGMIRRLDWLKNIQWQLVILDEAQAIKNPGSRQTRSVKALKASSRIAMSGTPVENRLSDLWSLFDFICPGLLGTDKEFGTFVKAIQKEEEAPDFSPLRDLVRPYILRRLKTDKSIITDLPDKTEMPAYCPLSKIQAALYEQSVEQLAKKLAETEDSIQRRGLVLAFIMRFKQICNHPSQWLNNGEYIPKDSGKFQRLQALCEAIAERQEKVLIFTQFKEIIDPLAAFLATLFNKQGLILHGSTSVKQRQERVKMFQEDEAIPFFILSLKAGGAGLNLTAASHVIHFDRWWNPAVENQATDRAYRIGQKRNVLVHKFICQGTIEDKIDAMIQEKSLLADDVIGEGKGGGEQLLTEMGDKELLNLVSLDLKAAAKSAQIVSLA